MSEQSTIHIWRQLLLAGDQIKPGLDLDHNNAFILAQKLSRNSVFHVRHNLTHTNIVYADIEQAKAVSMHVHLSSNNIKVNSPEPVMVDENIWFRFRFVTHLNINVEDIDRLVDCINIFDG